MAELLLGWVKRLRGARGELAIATRSDDLRPYLGLRQAKFARSGAGKEQRDLESVRIHGRRLIVKLRGIDSAAEAASWLGAEVWVERDVLPELHADAFYAYELLGMEVFTRDGTLLGRIADIQATGGCDLWVVRSESGREHLIPASRTICTSVDRRLGRVTVDPPKGLLELNAI
ncbi:MAG: ribosome maturation factor RimM [Acidobacteriota bacterium]